MKRLALLVFFLVAACGSIGAQAQTISLAYKAGDTSKYTFHMVLKYTIGAAGMSIPANLDLSAKEAVTVKSVDSDGTADLSVVISDVSTKTSMNGTTSTTTTTTSNTIDMKIAKDGRVVSVNGNAFGNSALPGISGGQGGIVSAILPDHAVKPGDTWTKSYNLPNPLGSGSVQATSNSTYQRDDTVNGVKSAVVESKANTNLDMTLDLSSMLGAAGTTAPTGVSPSPETLSVKGTSKSDTTTWIDTSGRRIVKTHSTGTVDATLTVNVPPPSPKPTTTPVLTGPISLKGTQTLDLTPA
ncbi:MAG TPA: hypothetical protein VJS19_12625 [Candidatus Dormibacteraeota bacterium]|nr:hypothetical protein [Candidatus Dormibacteraeota bacterium]